jgi:hypothetical protein
VNKCQPRQDISWLNPIESVVEFKDIELYIDSADAWLEEVKAELVVDDEFGLILSIFSGKLPANMKKLPPCEAKTWRKAHVHAIKYSLDDGLLYHSISSEIDDCVFRPHW